MARIPIAAEVRRRIREDARNRCGYCQSQQKYVIYPLTIEHIIPRSAFAPGDPAMHAESNLWLSCQSCNGYKGVKTHDTDPLTNARVPLFNPRTQVWNEHFEWSSDGTRVIGKTPTGRATVIALRLDSDPRAICVRDSWFKVGWHPPKD